MAILLLSTEACHLCELAQQVLQQAFSQPEMQQLMASQVIDVFIQDIIDQPELLELYGEKIPVLLNEKTRSTLCWPFDVKTTVAWIQKNVPQAGSV